MGNKLITTTTVFPSLSTVKNDKSPSNTFFVSLYRKSFTLLIVVKPAVLTGVIKLRVICERPIISPAGRHRKKEKIITTNDQFISADPYTIIPYSSVFTDVPKMNQKSNFKDTEP